ncbi:MAG: hypothetical protein DME79_07495 [Verrucomicrobia bacterium]|nr:MAG: hypothetical protein DME79_07495 [Verrucomicrobiota bacterium]
MKAMRKRIALQKHFVRNSAVAFFISGSVATARVLRIARSPNFALSSFHLPWHSARSSGK